MSFCILPSDPHFEMIYFYADMIAKYKNPHLFFGLQDLPDAERLAEISALETLFEELTH